MEERGWELEVEEAGLIGVCRMLSKLLDRHLDVDVSRIRKGNFLEAQRAFEAKIIKSVDMGHGWMNVTSCPLCKASPSSSKASLASLRCK